MSALAKLQEWYLAQCNEDWEHTYGVSIGTLDNPGWSLTVELTDTYLEAVKFVEHSYGVGADGHASGNEWLICRIEDRKFVGYGGPRKLEEMISVFLSWAEAGKEGYDD
jgi:hypothetical protein